MGTFSTFPVCALDKLSPSSSLPLMDKTPPPFQPHPSPSVLVGCLQGALTRQAPDNMLTALQVSGWPEEPPSLGPLTQRGGREADGVG